MNGIVSKMWFSEESNPYVGRIIQKNDKYILIIKDTLNNHEYSFISDEQIYILDGGDIPVKQ